MTELRTEVGKTVLELPGMVASGIMDETGASMIRMLEAGAGAVVTKSIGLVPKPGHENPCFTEVKGGFVNAMGLPNPGIELFREEMEEAVRAWQAERAALEKKVAEMTDTMEGVGKSILFLSTPSARRATLLQVI